MPSSPGRRKGSDEPAHGGAVPHPSVQARIRPTAAVQPHEQQQWRRHRLILDGVAAADVTLVVTAYHVVSHAVRILVAIDAHSSEPVPSELLMYNARLDVAVVRVPIPLPRGVVPLEVGDSDAAAPNMAVQALGFALADVLNYTVGHISSRTTENLQSDAAINPGNSGGPLLELGTRKVLGVVIKGYDASDAQNISYCTPIVETLRAIRHMEKQLADAPEVVPRRHGDRRPQRRSRPRDGARPHERRRAPPARTAATCTPSPRCMAGMREGDLLRHRAEQEEAPRRGHAGPHPRAVVEGRPAPVRQCVRAAERRRQGVRPVLAAQRRRLEPARVAVGPNLYIGGGGDTQKRGRAVLDAGGAGGAAVAQALAEEFTAVAQPVRRVVPAAPPSRSTAY